MRTYLKAFLFLALTASIACAGANFAQAAETAPAASAGNGMMPPVGTFDNNAAYQALTPVGLVPRTNEEVEPPS